MQDVRILVWHHVHIRSAEWVYLEVQNERLWHHCLPLDARRVRVPGKRCCVRLSRPHVQRGVGFRLSAKHILLYRTIKGNSPFFYIPSYLEQDSTNGAITFSFTNSVFPVSFMAPARQKYKDKKKLKIALEKCMSVILKHLHDDKVNL